MNPISTRDPRFLLRTATPDDAALVVSFMKKLGAYQKMADKVTATAQDIHQLLTGKKGEAVLGMYDGQPVAFVYFCQTSSAFTGQSGLYIDAFLVDDAMRAKGLGKTMMAFLSKLALDRGCQRLEWGCLDWNLPAIGFYSSLGATAVDAMTIHRFGPEQLKANAAAF